MIWIKIAVLILGFTITILSITYNESKKKHIMIAFIGGLFIILSSWDIYEMDKERKAISLQDLEFSLYLTGAESPRGGHALDYLFESQFELDGAKSHFSREISLIGTIADSIKFKAEFQCITVTTTEFREGEKTVTQDKKGEFHVQTHSDDSVFKEVCFIQKNIHYMKDSKGYLSNIDDLNKATIALNGKIVIAPKDWIYAAKLRIKNSPESYEGEVDCFLFEKVLPGARRLNTEFHLPEL